MSLCKHRTLVLLTEEKNKLRCRHCHLKILEDELENGYCPECYEVHHEKRYDFEKIVPEEKESVRYLCEDCGVILEYNM